MKITQFNQILLTLTLTLTLTLLLTPILLAAQSKYDALIDKNLKNTLLIHKELVSIPNIPADKEVMLQNIDWVAEQYEAMDFDTTLLPSSTLPILLVEKEYDAALPTVLFYFHIDGQPVNPQAWAQADPFMPVLKAMDTEGEWQSLDWARLDGAIDDEWRVYARAAADDKAPIIMFLKALDIIDETGCQSHAGFLN